jgi:hypothetical protein
MYHQVDNHLLNQAQFGRPGGGEGTPQPNLHAHTHTHTHTPMGQFESDAMACFDREVMRFVLTCYHSTGAPLGPPLRTWEQVLHNIVHKVKTDFGLSSAGYSFSNDSPIHGPGQGSKGGPGSCSTMTSILIDGMPRLCHGLQFTDPAQQLQYQATVSMFVDDASNGTNRFIDWLHETPSLPELVEMNRHDSQTWERFLWISGGLLNLTECAYYILAWTFDLEGRAKHTPKSDILNLRVTSGNQPGTEKVEQLNFDETHKYLGNHLSTDMQMTDAFRALMTISLSYATGLLYSSLTERDTWVAYFAVYIPSMTYTLPVSHHPPKKLRKLQSKATRATLMKLGFNRNIAHKVVYDPSRFDGLGFRDLAVEQGISQTELLIRHLRAGSPQGKLFRITIAWWQLVTGKSYPLLEFPSPTLRHQQTHWLSSMRAFLSEMEASIHIHGLTDSLTQPLRTVDACIMEAVTSLPNISIAHLRAFNRYRIYFGVAFVSEIGMANGSGISRDVWDGTIGPMSPLLWPYQPCPSPKSFRVWRRLLATAFLRGNRGRVSSKTLDLSLRRQLGSWLPSSESFRYQWPSFYSISANSLFLLSDDEKTFTIHKAKIWHPGRPPFSFPSPIFLRHQKHLSTLSSVLRQRKPAQTD